jgi:membrane protein
VTAPTRSARDVILRVWRRLTREEASVLAAGIAFYGFLALLPGLLSVFVVYGALADPEQVPEQLAFLARLLPPDSAAFLAEELPRMIARSQKAIGPGAIVSFLVALWSASKGMKGILTALGPSTAPIASLGRFRRKALAVCLASGALLVIVVAIAAVVAIPDLMRRLGLSNLGAILVGILRWPALAAIVFAWLAIVYRYGPATGPLPWRRVAWGALAATWVWLLGSAAFSAYLARFGQDPLYESVAGVIALLVWFLLAAYSVLLGAELNAALRSAPETGPGPAGPSDPPSRYKGRSRTGSS